MDAGSVDHIMKDPPYCTQRDCGKTTIDGNLLDDHLLA